MSIITIETINLIEFNSELENSCQQQIKGGYSGFAFQPPAAAVGGGGHSLSLNFSSISTSLTQKHLNIAEGAVVQNGSNSITTNYFGIPAPPVPPAV